jgi:hypothetical protein
MRILIALVLVAFSLQGAAQAPTVSGAASPTMTTSSAPPPAGPATDARGSCSACLSLCSTDRNKERCEVDCRKRCTRN